MLPQPVHVGTQGDPATDRGVVDGVVTLVLTLVLFATFGLPMLLLLLLPLLNRSDLANCGPGFSFNNRLTFLRAREGLA